MVFAFLLLILVPVIAWRIARAYRPDIQWAIAGTTFGMVAHPFFLGLSIPLTYAGFPIGTIAFVVALFHAAPGRQLVVDFVGHKRLTGLEDLWVYALNAIIWAVVYGIVGLLVEAIRAKTNRENVDS